MPTEERLRFYCTVSRDIKKFRSLTLREQHSTHLAHPPHYMRPLWVGQAEKRTHHLLLRGCLQT